MHTVTTPLPMGRALGAGLRRLWAGLCVGLCALLLALPGQAAWVNQGDGTVLDNVTGLVWARCAYGYTGDDCSETIQGSAQTFTWQAALQQAVTANQNTYLGRADWRVPNRPELTSLLVPGNYPRIDAVFPNVVWDVGGSVHGYIWSSTNVQATPGKSWWVDFASGAVDQWGQGDYTNFMHLRLVRGGGSLAAFDLTTAGLTLSSVNVSAINAGSAQLNAATNDPATTYWMVVPDGAVAPTAAQLLGTDAYSGATAQGNAASSGSYSFSVTGLQSQTNYAAYLVASDGTRQSNQVGPVRFHTPDVTPPQTQLLGVDHVSANSARAQAQIDESGTGYWTLQALGTTPPSATTLATSGQSVTLSAGVPLNWSLEGLTPASDYTLYFVAKDLGGNLQQEVGSVNFSTLAVQRNLVLLSLSATGATAQLTTNLSGTGYWLVQAQGQAAPDAATLQGSGQSVTLVPGQAQTLSLTGLTPATAYTLYYLARDALDQPIPGVVDVGSLDFVTLDLNLPGGIDVSFNGGSAACGLASVQLQTMADVPGTPPAGYLFPFPVLSFSTTDCGRGASIEVRIQWPGSLPTGLSFFKYGPEPANADDHWYIYPAQITGNVVSFTVVDNGLGDSNPADGLISDPATLGLPIVPPPPPPVDTSGINAIPTVSTAGLALLALALAALGGVLGVRRDKGRGRAE